MDGILNVYKEQGYTSFDVVAKLRGILKQKKIGHTGTLDPMAEGVLMVCLGKATKLVDMLTMDKKEYKTVLLLGKTTDTDDVTGTVLKTSSVNLNNDEILSVINSFVGKYNQLPPMYSAIKINGKKLYEYARAGVEVERTKRPVEIFSINNIEINIPYVSFDVKCSKGTYIRSLCRDIGEKLGCGGTMQALIRNKVHNFSISNALKIEEIKDYVENGTINDHILPIDSILNEYPQVTIKEQYSNLLRNGNKLTPECFKNISCDLTKDGTIIRVYDGSSFLALYTYVKCDTMFKPYKMFL